MAWARTALAHGPARACQAWAWFGQVMGEAWAWHGRAWARVVGLLGVWACARLARHGLGRMGLRAPAELGRGLR